MRGATPIKTIRLLQMIEHAPRPRRADRSGGGTIPASALRYCEALTTATGFGWWIFCPINLKLRWDGYSSFLWWCEGLEDWIELDESAQFPHQAEAFNRAAPPHLRGRSPPFLTKLSTPGRIQIWTGLVARTAPDWSVLVRAPANLPKRSGIDYFEGILEADLRHLPLFVNLQINCTNRDVSIRSDIPFAQVQPLQRASYSDETLSSIDLVSSMGEFGPEEWAGIESAFPERDMSSLGEYAVSVRKRRRQEASAVCQSAFNRDPCALA